MNLSDLDLGKMAEAGAVMEVMHPVTGERLTDENGDGIFIRLAGRDSKSFRAKQQEINVARLQRLAKSKDAPLINDADSSALLASVTMEWNLKDKGKEIPCDYDSVVKVYEQYVWLREQVDQFVGDRANFFPSPSK